MRNWIVYLAWTVIALGAGGLANPLRLQAETEALAPLDLARKLNRAFVEVAKQVSPSVVVVQVAHRPGFRGSFEESHPFWDQLPPEFRKQFEDQFKERRPRPPASPFRRDPAFSSQGSGVVIREDGFILTNRHVVDGADKIKVRFKNGSEYPAEIKGEDAQSDIAVLKIEASGLAAARVGDSSRTQVGEFAIAIGAPYDLDYSVTFGHVSAKGRSQLLPDNTMDQDFIQTDANINPGNSGGPLVNIEGEVIGINTLIRGLRSGIGFAIPINLAMEVAEKLISDGKYVRAWLGVGIRSLRSHQEYRNLVTEIEEGVVVTMIRRDGPAFDSDLQPNDIITEVDGNPVTTEIELKAAIRSKDIGREISLRVHRLDENFHGQNLIIAIRPEAWPEELFPVAVVRQPLEADPGIALGVRVELLTKDLAEKFGVDQIPGIVVTEVLSGSAAQEKGIRPGDIITEVNQTSVNTPKKFREALKDADLKKGVIINFTSQGMSKFEVFRKMEEE